MKATATEPFYSEERKAYTGTGWIVGVRYHYEPGETVKTVHGLHTFETQDEALAFFHATNGTAQ